MTYCSKCGKNLYYTGGCMGEWEHIGDCSAETDTEFQQTAESERK